MDYDGRRGEKQRVLIAGAGIAGIEAALALRDLAGDRVAVDLYDPRREFVSRPFAVGEPYGAARIFRYDMRSLADRCGAGFYLDSIVSVDAEHRLAVTHGGERPAYDYLVVACGVRMLWAVPGAVTFWGMADEGQVGDVVADLRAGRLRSLAFTMPGGRSWALPLYELALLSAAELAKAGLTQTHLTVITPEDSPLELFGRSAGERMSGLLEDRGIEVVTGARPVKFEGGRLWIDHGEAIEVDAVISLPRLEGRRIAGIPHDLDGFVDVDGHGRAIGLDRVFAAGDITAFAVKQGGIAAQQADAAAETIAFEVGAEVDPQPFDPVLHDVLWTGRYLTSFLDLLAAEPPGAVGPSSAR